MPQFVVLVLVSTQAVPQSVSLLGHVVVHVPFEQACPVPHALPQLPQSALVEVVSTHLPLQFVRLPEHVMAWQAPIPHATPAAHDLPQPPQFAVFEVVSAH